LPIVQATDVPLQPFPTGRTSPQAPSDYQQIPTDVSEFGALQGQALEKLAAGGEKLATGIAHVAAYQQHVFDQTELTKMRMREDDAIYDASWGATDPATGKKVGKGFLDLYGSEATDVGPPKKQLDDARDAIAASAPNDRVRQMFLQQSRAARQAADNRFAAHYSQQLEHAQEDTNKGVILQSGRDAGTARNDDEFEDAVNKGRVGAAGTKDPVTNGLLADDHNTGSYIAAQIAKGNYAEADRILKKYGHFLTGDRQKTYADALLAHTERDKMRDVESEVFGDKPAPGGGGGGGTGEAPGPPGPNPQLATQRAPFANELKSNPALKKQLAALVDLENPDAGTAVVESLMNRMVKNGGTIASGIGGGSESFYGPVRRGSVDARLAELEHDPAKMAARMRQIDQALAGSNIIKGYTDQGSKNDPNYETGGAGINIAGERFNYHGGDTPENREWRAKHQAELGTQVATGPAVTATDATQGGLPGVRRGALPATGPAAEVAADVAAEPTPGAPAPAVPQAGPKPMISIEEAYRRANEIATKRGFTDDQREKALRRVQYGYNIRRANVEEQRKRLSDELVNGEALLKDGRPFSYDEAKLRSLVPPDEADKIVGALKDAEDQGAATIAVGRLSPSEETQWRKALSEDIEKYPQGAAKRIRYLQHFDAAAQQRNNQLHSEGADPATYLISRDQKFPTPGGPPSIADLHKAAFPETGPMDPVAFQAYASASLAEQARLGVLPEKQNVLPKPQAAGLATYFAKTDPGTADIGAQLAQMQKQYGPYWDKAYGDMVKAGLPRATRVIAQMSQPEQGPGRQNYQEMLKLSAEKGGMERFRKTNFEEKDLTDISREVRDSLDDFRRSSPVGAGLSEDTQVATEEQALYYKYHGASVSEAVKQAYKDMVDYKYDFVASGNHRLRVPKGYQGIAESAGDAVQHHILPSELANNIPAAPGVRPETAQANMLDAIRSGYWQTNEADNGAVLYLRTRDGWHDIARLKDGQRVEFKWNDARRLSQFAPPIGGPGYVSGGGEVAPGPEMGADRGFAPLGYRGLMLGGT
jgi:hypothetical protein